MRSELSVEVSIAELLDIMKSNLAKHRSRFEKAFEGFRKRMIDAMERNLEAARSGKDVILKIHEVKPSDHSDQYETVIGMLEMARRAGATELTISQEMYQNYVQDCWGWSDSFMSSTSVYLDS